MLDEGCWIGSSRQKMALCVELRILILFAFTLASLLAVPRKASHRFTQLEYNWESGLFNARNPM